MSTTQTNTPQRRTQKSAWARKMEQLDAWYDVWCQTQEAKILQVWATAVLVLITAVVIFGYPALVVAKLAAVPAIFFVLLRITVGK